MKDRAVNMGVDPTPRSNGKGVLVKPVETAHRALGRRDSPPRLPFKGTLASASRRVKGGKTTMIGYAAALVDEDERFKVLVEHFIRLSRREQEATSLDCLCASANIAPGEFLGKVTQVAFEQNMDVSNMIAAVHQPDVVAYTIRQALRPKGHQDRRMLFQHSGFLPTPKGAEIHILNALSARASTKDDEKGGLPDFESEVIELSAVTREK